VSRTVVASVREGLGRRLGVDRRSLAAFRAALALVLLVDLAWRAPDLVAFYTDGGVLPRSLLGTLEPGYETVSVHALSGSPLFQVFLFVLAAVAALALLAGYRTRLAAALSFLLLVSIQLRNPFGLNSGDVLLRRLLFWSLFLPLGSRWAVDAGDDGTDSDDSVVGLATAGLLVQVVLVYATNAVVKLRADVWLRGDAVRYAFQLDHFTVGLGTLVAGWAPVLTAVDWLWLSLLVASPLLLVVTGWRRATLVGLFAGAHFGMALTMQLGVFPLVSITSLLPLLPGTVWDRVQQRVSLSRRLLPAHSTPTPLADRVSGLSGLARTIAGCCLVVLLVTNAVGLGVVAAPAGTPEQATERSWDMFAPSPPRATWWYAAPATLTSGDRVDAITGDSLDTERPAEIATQHRSQRWRKLFADARTEPRLRRSLAGYLCARWNRTHDDEMVDVSLWLLTEPTDLDGPESVRRERQGTYRCGPA
jgi:hypothetical protein